MGSYGSFSNDDIRHKTNSKKAGRWFVIIAFMFVLVAVLISGNDEGTRNSIMNGISNKNINYSITTGNDISIVQGCEFSFPVIIHNSVEKVITITSVEFDDVIQDNFRIVSSAPVQNNSIEDNVFKYNLDIPSYDFVSIEYLISPTLHGKHSGEIEVCFSDGQCSSQDFIIIVTKDIFTGGD